MSIDSILSGVAGISNQIGDAAGTVARVGSDFGFGQLGAGQGDEWFANLRPAKFRGIPFVVWTSGGSHGRRNAIHEYPYRDTVWVEDLGRAGRRISMTGFLVTSPENGDVVGQRERMIAKAEQGKDGLLVHPTLGELTVSLIDFSWTERWDKGRMFEISFVFMEAGKRVFPTSVASTRSAVLEAADLADSAAAASYASRTVSALQAGVTVVQQAATTAGQWGRTAQKAVNGATNLYHLAVNLPGTFGRFFGSLNKEVKTTLSLEGLVAQGVTARAAVSQSVSGMVSAASSSSPADFAISAQAVTNAVQLAAPDPGEGMRALITMAGFAFSRISSVAPIGDAINLVGSSQQDLFRRAAIVSASRAASIYDPTSSIDASNVSDLITGLLDDAILQAGDQGEDDAFESLRALRAAVSRDMTQRGANLADVVTVRLNNSMPALTLAYRLYQDVSRTEELIVRVDPIHPAFMPTQFSALSE